MARLIVAVLLIPCVLLTQFAAVPHTHAGAEHDGHTQPHFHLHLFCPASTAREVVATRECCTDQVCPSVVLISAQLEGDAPWDHDADAVYVDATVAPTERAKQDSDAAQGYSLPAAQVELFALHDSITTHPPRYPDHVRTTCECPIYLRHRALTI